MTFFNRKKFKFLFSLACAIVVAFMVGYWFYKCEIDDRDIGVVDYTPMIEMEEATFPVVSLCLKDPFLSKKLTAINSNITSTTYVNYLAGNIYDDLHERGGKYGDIVQQKVFYDSDIGLIL